MDKKKIDEVADKIKKILSENNMTIVLKHDISLVPVEEVNNKSEVFEDKKEKKPNKDSEAKEETKSNA